MRKKTFHHHSVAAQIEFVLNESIQLLTLHWAGWDIFDKIKCHQSKLFCQSQNVLWRHISFSKVFVWKGLFWVKNSLVTSDKRETKLKSSGFQSENRCFNVFPFSKSIPKVLILFQCRMKTNFETSRNAMKWNCCPPDSTTLHSK